MANSKYLRWINNDKITTKIAQRFVEFCDEDIEQRANAENFDADIYQDAMKLIIDRFEGNTQQIPLHDDAQGNSQKSQSSNDVEGGKDA